MERLRPWLVWWATVAVTAMFSFLYLHGWRAGFAIVIGSGALVALALLFRDLFRRRPRLEGLGVECKPVSIDGKGGFIAYIKVANCPKVGMESIQALSVTLRYLDAETRKPLYDYVYGRWSHLARVTDPPEADAHRRVTLTGDGNPLRVEITSSFGGTPQMFVIDDQAHLKGYQSRPLGGDPVIVEARFQGATPGRHIDKTLRYSVAVQSHGMTVEEVKK